jgi:type II secretory pathway component HofQ
MSDRGQTKHSTYILVDTYLFRIDKPHKHISPIQDLDDFLTQVLANLRDRKNEDVFIAPERKL